MNDVRTGDLLVTGHKGIRVLPLERSRESQPFEFMASAVSSEKPKAQIVHEVAHILRQVKDEGRLTIAVVGPAVVHTGAAPQLARLIEAGYIGAVFGGNAIATHDIESNLYGTSLGINLKEGTARARRPRAPPARHQHHPALRRHPGRRRPGRPHGRPHVHAHQDRHAVRARRQHPRRRPDAGGDHRRDAGAAGDAQATRSRPAPA